MKIIKNTLIGLFLAFTIIFLVNLNGSNVKAAGVDFSVSPVFSTGQNKKQSAYYDLKSKPNQTYQLKAAVKNSSDHDITIHASANTALTSDNANINYGENNAKTFDTSMKYPFSKLVTDNKKNLHIPANQSVITSFNVKAPAVTFPGKILGSLTFTNDPDKNGNTKGKLTIHNAYSYALPVLISENVDAQPNLKLLKAGGKLINGSNSFYGRFRNNQPNLMTSVKMSGAIYSKNGYDNHEKPLYTNINRNASIAPNSSFKFLVPTNNQAFKSGDYVYVGKVDWGKHHWKYVKDFHMSFAKAYHANKEATGVHADYTWLWLLLAALLIILILIIIIIKLYLKNKHNSK
ncbi:DUF916 and DUF3324 domain-containing protein [Apilactobacillus quenuiae]|uniref:DUF916 and DUF3324 domain-containing protein n=1 Tax=Apilactobacillus quenuiae TaxID=2008377 RepID=UPI000D01E04D|nr:DUF916 and DUF3324 domain-containing protein [Apilactobacillus quenuiae]